MEHSLKLSKNNTSLAVDATEYRGISSAASGGSHSLGQCLHRRLRQSLHGAAHYRAPQRYEADPPLHRQNDRLQLLLGLKRDVPTNTEPRLNRPRAVLSGKPGNREKN
jgi:hypothetical protein